MMMREHDAAGNFLRQMREDNIQTDAEKAQRGNTVEFQAPTRLRRLKVEEILYQPESAGNYNRFWTRSFLLSTFNLRFFKLQNRRAASRCHAAEERQIAFYNRG